MPRLESCYTEALTRRPRLKGRLVYAWTVHRDGRSIGETLVADGLAHEWRGRKESWCG